MLPPQWVKASRKLRKDSTPHEQKLWFQLRNRRLGGFKFHRQFIIEKFIVDFCCDKVKVVIELDGGGHNEEIQKSKDKNRDFCLEKLGYQVIRIWNHQIDRQMEEVLEHILTVLNRRSS